MIWFGVANESTLLDPRLEGDHFAKLASSVASQSSAGALCGVSMPLGGVWELDPRPAEADSSPMTLQ